MLTIELPEKECYNEMTGEFYNVAACTLQLEHSLISVSKWESKWKIPFLEQKQMTRAQLVDYVRCMTLNQKVDPKVYATLDANAIKQVEDYIKDPHTATTIFDPRKGGNGQKQIVTSELLYWQMIYYGVPVAICEKWHLNRLTTLLRICTIKGTDNQMSQADIFAQNRMLHAMRGNKGKSGI